MRRILLAATFLLLVLLPVFGITSVKAEPQGRAVIISSLEKYVPTAYLSEIIYALTSIGYNVTIVKDTSVTVSFLTTQLNNYDVVIWRTNAYSWMHREYWYLGELSNQATLQAYADDVANGWLDNTNGILGVNVDFFYNHFGRGSLANIKLAVLISTDSLMIAQVFMRAGVTSTIFYYGTITLAYGVTDYTTRLVFMFLSRGQTVSDAVTNTIITYRLFNQEDQLDSSYFPQIYFMGHANMTLRAALGT